MKVCFLTPEISKFSGGLATSIRPLYHEYLKINKNATHLAATYSPSASIGAEGGYKSITRLLHLPMIALYVYRSVKKLINQRPDIIHLHGLWALPSLVVFFYLRFFEAKLIISPHGMLDDWAVKKSSFKKNIALLFFENTNISSAACIHALSANEYAQIRRRGYSNPIAIIPNGIHPPPVFHQERKPQWFKPSIANKKKLLFLSRLDPKKNLDSLIRAWALLEDKYKDSSWILVIAGWGERSYVSMLLDLINKLGLSESIKLIGPVFENEKHLTMLNVDGFVLPSLSEGLPIAILEAFVYRLPVLMSINCNLEEAFISGAAYEIDVDPAIMKNDLEYFFELSEYELKLSSEKAYSLARKKFSWDIIANDFSSLYDWILTNKSLPNFVVNG